MHYEELIYTLPINFFVHLSNQIPLFSPILGISFLGKKHRVCELKLDLFKMQKEDQSKNLEKLINKTTLGKISYK